MSRIYMIRHGKPSSTWGGHDDDPGLDEVGRAQAEEAARTLLALRPTRVISSPLRRCRETAEPLARLLGVEVEIDPNVGEVPTPADLDPAARPDWLRRVFGGTWADADLGAWRAGVAQAVLNHSGAAVFSHYVAINAAVSSALDDDRVMGFRPDHCSITVFEAGERLILVQKGREAATQVL